MTETKDKRYIMIVGASGGIGEEVAKTLSTPDTELILVGRRRERLTRISEKLVGQAYVMECDVSDSESVSLLFSKISSMGIKLTGFVYCVGVWDIKPCKAVEMSDLEHMFQVNVFGFYYICKHFYSPSASCKGASIVGLSSIASLTCEAGTSVYAMTKAAMNAMVKTLAAEFVKRQIRINAVLPAVVASQMGYDEDQRTDEDFENIRMKQPLGVIPLDETAELIKYLISDKSAHMTGELITLSAGYKG